MVNLTRLNEQPVTVNAAHIVTVEATPDTILTLMGGEKIIVREDPDEVAARVMAYLRRVGWTAMVWSPAVRTQQV